jgi:hypothetical protein
MIIAAFDAENRSRLTLDQLVPGMIIGDIFRRCHTLAVISGNDH